MKVALVHDYLREYGGAERVLEVLHEIFPDAPVYTAYLNLKAMRDNGNRFSSWNIKTSWFQHFPFANKLLSPFRIFGPMMFESFDLSEFDLVISSSSATHLAKAVITKPETLHVSYIHTPPRFLYGYTTSFNYKKHFWTRIGGEVINHIMRIYDFEVSQRPDILIANYKNVQNRIKKFYRRDSIVIYPPVELSAFSHLPLRGTTVIRQSDSRKLKTDSYFLVLSRLVRGKGVEVVVEACGRLGLPLKVAGSGPELDNLKKLTMIHNSKFMIQFLGWVSDEERVNLLQNAKALIVASEDEDFGITSIEAQAAGTPVIAPASGGFLETVINGPPSHKASAFGRHSRPMADEVGGQGPPSHKASAGQGKTGILYGKEGLVTVEDLIEALQKFESIKFDPGVLRKNAEKFSKENFKKEILELIEKNLKH